MLVVSRLDSPLGALLLACRADGAVVALDFGELEGRFRARLGEAVEGAAPAAVARALEGYFAGDVRALEGVLVAPVGREFQLAVWAELRRIPAGETRSYGEVARALGAPGASRAVGLANGRNPVMLVIPCHRVIGADGALTGYAGGVARKAWLLRHEGALAATLV
jgi:methylated-DNA-[protein]-cysteine S-methyltransferase